MGLCLSLSLRMSEGIAAMRRGEKGGRRKGRAACFKSQNGSKLVPNQPWRQHMAPKVLSRIPPRTPPSISRGVVKVDLKA